MLFLLSLAVTSAQQDGCNQPLDSHSISRMYATSGLVSDCPADAPSSTSFCFSSATSTNGNPAFAGFVLSSPFVIRSVSTAPIDALNMPTLFKLQSLDSSGNPAWYVDPGEAADGSSWTLLQSMQTLGSDFDLSSFRIYPVSSVAGAQQPMGFSVVVRGCPESQTAMASLQFASSIEVIKKRFSTTSNFVTELQGQLCKMLGLAETCRQILASSVTEEDSVLSSGTPRAPQLQVNFRVLPPASDCATCAHPQALVAKLETDLANPASTATQVLNALQNWVQDDSPFMCAGKSCPFGTQCFSGVCIDPSTVSVSAIASNENVLSYAPSPTFNLQDLAVDEVLTRPQLVLINGAPVPKASLQFSSQISQKSDTITQAPSALNIAYIVIGACVVVAVGFAVWFLYFR